MFIVAPVDNGYIVTITEKGSGIKKQKIATNKDEVLELFREYDAKQRISKKQSSNKIDSKIKKIIGEEQDE